MTRRETTHITHVQLVSLELPVPVGDLYPVVDGAEEVEEGLVKDLVLGVVGGHVVLLSLYLYRHPQVHLSRHVRSVRPLLCK